MLEKVGDGAGVGVGVGVKERALRPKPHMAGVEGSVGEGVIALISRWEGVWERKETDSFEVLKVQRMRRLIVEHHVTIRHRITKATLLDVTRMKKSNYDERSRGSGVVLDRDPAASRRSNNDFSVGFCKKGQ